MTAHVRDYDKRLLKRFVEIKAILFGFTILHLVAMAVYVVRYSQKYSAFSDHWNPSRILQEPVLLFLGAAALLVSKLWGYLVAIVTSGIVIYEVGYLGLVATSSAHGRSILTWYVAKTWWVNTFTAQPQYIIELVLATVIGTYAIRLLWRHLRKSPFPK